MSSTLMQGLSANDYSWLHALLVALKNAGITVGEENLDQIINEYITDKSKIVLSDAILLINAKVIKSLFDLSVITQLLDHIKEEGKRECRRRNTEYQEEEAEECRKNPSYEESASYHNFKNIFKEVESYEAFDRNKRGNHMTSYSGYATPYFQLYEAIKKYYGYGAYYPENKEKIFNFIFRIISIYRVASVIEEYVDNLFCYQEFWADTQSVSELSKSATAIAEVRNTKFIIFKPINTMIQDRKVGALKDHISSLVSTISEGYRKRQRESQISLLLKNPK